MPRPALSPTEIARGTHIGHALREARGTRSPSEVADAAGVSSETLRKIESGRIATPAFATVALIAGVVGVSLDGLWHRTLLAVPDPVPETTEETA